MYEPLLACFGQFTVLFYDIIDRNKKRDKDREEERRSTLCINSVLCFGLLDSLLEVWRLSKSSNTPQQSTKDFQ